MNSEGRQHGPAEVAVPVRSEEQRLDALAIALEARARRTEFKRAVAAGAVSAGDALQAARGDRFLEKMRVAEFVRCFPGYGPSRAVKLLNRLGIAESRRIRGLGRRQIVRLADALDPADER